jgi:hypothetical protein
MAIRDTEIAQKLLWFSKPTDIAIHWKALEERILVVQIFGVGIFLKNLN